jgi:hypothetical protein
MEREELLKDEIEKIFRGEKLPPVVPSIAPAPKRDDRPPVGNGQLSTDSAAPVATDSPS